MSEICIRAKKYLDHLGKPIINLGPRWVMSEKYDGQRAIWTGTDLISRNGNRIEIPDWFREILLLSPYKLDGELYFGRGTFNLTGLFRSANITDKLWDRVKYLVFDVPDTTLNCGLTERLDLAKEAVSLMERRSPSLPVEVVKYIPVRSREHIDLFFKEITDAGGEGLVLRNSVTRYEFGQSSNFLKYKPHCDSEAEIIGYNPGKGKYAGMLGSFLVRMVENPRITFSVSGITDQVRRNYKESHPIGTIITVNYTEVSKSGKPRFPQYKGIRTDILKKPRIIIRLKKGN